jgi:hypothetical protein
MNHALKTSLRLLALLAVLGIASTPAIGCTACFGQSDSEMAQGMNWGIYTLLGVIGTVLVCIAGVFIVVGRRASHPVPPPSASEL